MTTRIRWEKDDQFIEIEDVESVDTNESVSIVKSNAFNSLPPKWRKQFSHQLECELNELIRSVKNWAESNGFVKANIES